MSDEDKLKRRYEALDKLIDILSHGRATIEWPDKTIIKIGQIDAKESEIRK